MGGPGSWLEINQESQKLRRFLKKMISLLFGVPSVTFAGSFTCFLYCFALLWRRFFLLFFCFVVFAVAVVLAGFLLLMLMLMLFKEKGVSLTLKSYH